MTIGQFIIRNGKLYRIYKIRDNKCFAAADESQEDIICIPCLSRVK